MFLKDLIKRKKEDKESLLEKVDNVLVKNKILPGKVDNITKQEAIIFSINNLFKASYFSVSSLSSMANLAGINISAERMAYYRMYHCIDYVEMNSTVKEKLFAIVLDDMRAVINYSEEEISESECEEGNKNNALCERTPTILVAKMTQQKSL